MKIYTNVLDHITFQNLLLQNRWTDGHDTWYVAFRTQVLPRLFKLWPWVDLDLFYGKVKYAKNANT